MLGKGGPECAPSAAMLGEDGLEGLEERWRDKRPAGVTAQGMVVSDGSVVGKAGMAAG